MKYISVIVPFEDEFKTQLAEITGSDYTITYGADRDMLAKANIVLGNPPVDMLDKMPNLEWIQLSMAGTDAYSRPGVLRDGIILTNVTGAFGLAISEHMVAAVTMLFKKLHLYRDNQSQAKWLDRGAVKQIEGSTVLVVGLGDIGGNFAKRMKGLGCTTIGIRRTGTDKPNYVDELYLFDKLDEVLPRADIVALALPNTPQTAGMFSRERIAHMKDDSTIINVGRGSAIDTEALCDALESGKLYAAALDVTNPEPLPSDHRLWKIENVLITPHISGFFHLRKTYENIIGISIENTKRYINGEDLLNIIDFQTGYRKL
jgi:Phosphoglycerate dehydrogenase and related dehydrogenases